MNDLFQISLLFAFGVVLLVQFIQIWIHGQVLIGEPHIGIRTFETILAVAIICYALVLGILRIRRR